MPCSGVPSAGTTLRWATGVPGCPWYRGQCQARRQGCQCRAKMFLVQGLCHAQGFPRLCWVTGVPSAGDSATLGCSQRRGDRVPGCPCCRGQCHAGGHGCLRCARGVPGAGAAPGAGPAAGAGPRGLGGGPGAGVPVVPGLPGGGKCVTGARGSPRESHGGGGGAACGPVRSRGRCRAGGGAGGGRTTALAGRRNARLGAAPCASAPFGAVLAAGGSAAPGQPPPRSSPRMAAPEAGSTGQCPAGTGRATAPGAAGSTGAVSGSAHRECSVETASRTPGLGGSYAPHRAGCAPAPHSGTGIFTTGTGRFCIAE